MAISFISGISVNFRRNHEFWPKSTMKKFHKAFCFGGMVRMKFSDHSGRNEMETTTMSRIQNENLLATKLLMQLACLHDIKHASRQEEKNTRTRKLSSEFYYLLILIDILFSKIPPHSQKITIILITKKNNVIQTTL